ncbi:MAG: ATP-binding cassette domain-containing protein [Clostridiales bacterium]|jgi:cell division transport system ATP-binding protein|nr:ATP-binding cassette domain-containing protein [Clostridiales bacterium]
MIQTVNVSKIYKTGMIALDDINIQVQAGEFVFLTGASGAGKSTLIRLLFREELPSAGKIFIAGRNIDRLSSKQRLILRRNIGIIFQDFRLLEKSSVFNNVAFAMKALEKPWVEIKRRVPEVLEKMGLSGREKELVQHLSGGEEQRGGVARAVVNMPHIVFADEPTGDLDPQTSWGLMQVFKQINLEGTTVVMATHDKEIVNLMQNRVLVLDKGRLIKDEAKGGWAL